MQLKTVDLVSWDEKHFKFQRSLWGCQKQFSYLVRSVNAEQHKLKPKYNLQELVIVYKGSGEYENDRKRRIS